MNPTLIFTENEILPSNHFVKLLIHISLLLLKMHQIKVFNLFFYFFFHLFEIYFN